MLLTQVSMSTRNKLIWDFRGPEAKHFAAHHAKHLREYVEAKHLEDTICEFEELSDMRAIAYMEGPTDKMEQVKPILKPQFEAPVK